VTDLFSKLLHTQNSLFSQLRMSMQQCFLAADVINLADGGLIGLLCTTQQVSTISPSHRKGKEKSIQFNMNAAAEADPNL